MVRNLINKKMTREIQSITDPVSINKKIVENSVEIYNIIKNTNCEFEDFEENNGSISPSHYWKIIMRDNKHFFMGELENEK